MSDIDFTVNRNDRGVTGFTLQGNDEFDSTNEARFCLSFVAAQRVGRATVTIEEDKIVFTHQGVDIPDPALLRGGEKYSILGVHEGGVRTFDVSPEDAAALLQLLHREGDYANVQIRVKYELAWGNGFTVYAEKQAVNAA